MRIASVFAGLAALSLAACGAETTNDAAAPAAEPEEAGPGNAEILDVILAGEWRGEDGARDVYRNPKETLLFFGVEPDMKVAEIWPSGGWYTKIIAPYLAQGGGTYYAVQFSLAPEREFLQTALQSFKENYVANPELFGQIELLEMSANTGAMAEPNSLDMVLSFRNVHNWMAGGYAEKALGEYYAALKPGGIFGVVEHRLPEGVEQDAKAPTGYVGQAYMIGLAEAAGFKFVESSEVNANPKDRADHPFGVWTLPPNSRTSGFGQDPDPEFDAAPYKEIGESDRFTLKFRKPEVGEDGALLE